ncbi:MAG: PIN/TRAM domain-containing protein [Eubacteriales bacterium]|nr:PIN/TRAM domain-containing protein [Eubacteriales bacterium]
MAKRILRIVFSLLGAALGCGAVALADQINMALGNISFSLSLIEGVLPLLYVFCGLVFAIIFYIISPKLIDGLASFMQATESRLTQMPITDVFYAVLGLIIGLLVALLLCTLVNRIPVPWLAAIISVVLYVFCGYMGVAVTIRKRTELSEPVFFQNTNAGGKKDKPGKDATAARPKVLDTSVIIDGRIFDICKTGVVEGTIVVPNFVLSELRHIADSADALKRGRGRRGLDILNYMQQELDIPVQVSQQDYDNIPEVDLKLLRLATDIGGVVVTNDYNLNKVASVQKVSVLNINELANAIKPVVLPGEEMRVQIVKEGKENGQGIGYLDDGTMIVVDGGKRLIGAEVDTVVTSVLQTAAGRMIFAKLK